ncbi:MAG TPA: zinc-ribbon domain-containing protein [Longimicrobiales bacterium]|nr:zinc-ribbon domain-containing protein [Longimicrobiales bacterium]
MTFTIECPACATTFPVDPEKVPAGGARTECTVCHTPFRVDDPAHEVEGEAFLDPWDAPEEGAEAATEGEEEHGGWESEPADVWEEEADEDYGEDAVTAVEDGGPDDESDREEPLSAIETEMEEGDETLEDMDGSIDDGLSEMAEMMDDGLILADEAGVAVGSGEEPSPPGDGLVTDQWSELVVDEAEGEVAADLESWGGTDDDADWIVDTEDEGVDLSGLDVEMDSVETVEGQMLAAQDEAGLAEPAEGIEHPLVPESDLGADLLGGDEMVLPADALDGLDDAGADGEPGIGDAPASEADQDAGDEATWDLGGSADDEIASEEPAAADVPADEGEEVFQFGRRDPHDKARRLARVLVSDMITYNPERHEQALANDRIREDFQDEIDKSWAEYVEQVGPELAESTAYWKDALNEILARGETLF